MVEVGKWLKPLDKLLQLLIQGGNTYGANALPTSILAE